MYWTKNDGKAEIFYIYKEDTKIKRYTCNNTKEWLTNHFPMNYKQLSELETGQMQQFRFIDWKGKRINSSWEKGKRINLIYFHFMLFSFSLSLTRSPEIVYYKSIYYLSFVEILSFRFFSLSFGSLKWFKHLVHS